jgi:hypothetical protein
VKLQDGTQPARSVRWLLALGLILCWLNGLAGCLSSAPTVNIAKEAGLARAAQLEIAERVSDPSTHYVPRLTITDPTILSQLTAALDSAAPKEPLAECLSQYHLSFALATGEVQVLEYYCEGGASFLRGDQAFWAGEQAKPPAKFDDLMTHLLQGSSN